MSMKCRFCNNQLSNIFADLDHSPPSNSYLTTKQLAEREVYYPLKVFVCEKCFLVQIDESKPATEIFDQNYAYFSSYSQSWLKHSEAYVQMMLDRFELTEKSLVVELASNDGYLLQYFKKNNVPVLGVEPTANTAAVAEEKGIHTVVEFFGTELANELCKAGKADVILANNVLAHVPDLNDFVEGIEILLKDDGVATIEFPHLYELIKNNQFDTIYHEHFSYFSFNTVFSVFKKHKLELFDVQQLPTHGGSLRIFAKHEQCEKHKNTSAVQELLDFERRQGLLDLKTYESFQTNINAVKNDLLSFLLAQSKDNKTVVGYGAAAKGNTLLNYSGIRKDLVHFIVDASPYKQNTFTPGTHIPIVDEAQLKTLKPDYILVLPWNLIDEVRNQLAYIEEWGGHFVVAVPKLKIL